MNMESGRSALTIPGLGDSGPQHWQSLWPASRPEYQRVRQAVWEHPSCSDWVSNLDAAISAASRPVALVAHSMGCIAVVHWAATKWLLARTTRLPLSNEHDSSQRLGAANQ